MRDEQHDWDGSACKRCGRKLTSGDISGLSDQSHIVGIALDISEAAELRVAAIKQIQDQAVLLGILNGDSGKNVIGFDRFRWEALTMLHDEEMLRTLAESSDDYPKCFEVYRKLGVIPMGRSVPGLMDVIRQLSGTNRSGLIDYIIDYKLVGAIKVTSEDIEALSMDKDIRLLVRIANSGSGGLICRLRALARDKAKALCEEAGGHHFDHSHICEVCSVKECEITGVHYLDHHCCCAVCGESFHTVLDKNSDGPVCERCKAKFVTEYWSYYDGVPGYGTTVSGSTRYIVYPDGTKEARS